MQGCLQLTPEQKAEMLRLRAVALAKQAENQAQWHQLCAAIAQVTAPNAGSLHCAKHHSSLYAAVVLVPSMQPLRASSLVLHNNCAPVAADGGRCIPA